MGVAPKRRDDVTIWFKFKPRRTRDMGFLLMNQTNHTLELPRASAVLGPGPAPFATSLMLANHDLRHEGCIGKSKDEETNGD